MRAKLFLNCEFGIPGARRHLRGHWYILDTTKRNLAGDMQNASNKQTKEEGVRQEGSKGTSLPSSIEGL